jgi:hypothetical protein
MGSTGEGAAVSSALPDSRKVPIAETPNLASPIFYDTMQRVHAKSAQIPVAGAAFDSHI